MIKYDPHHSWLYLLNIRGGLLKEIVGRFGVTTLWAAGVVGFHLNVHKVGIPTTGHTLAGTALSLLLVFRTNSSYDRFWEGRKLGGESSTRRATCCAPRPSTSRPPSWCAAWRCGR